MAGGEGISGGEGKDDLLRCNAFKNVSLEYEKKLEVEVRAKATG